MLEYRTGDLFALDTDILVNTVNCKGVMGAGLALAFKTRYPAMFADYQRKCKAGRIKPGGIDEWTDPRTGKTILNFATKDHWREPSRYEYIRDGLVLLREYLAARGEASVALPALGAGHGGLEWTRVREMIEQHLDDLHAEITVFSPIDSREVGRKVASGYDEATRKLLHDQGILIVGPGDADYPTALRGRSAARICIKGDVNRLDRPLLAILPSNQPDEQEQKEAIACINVLVDKQVTCLVGYRPGVERGVIRTLLDHRRDVVILLEAGIGEFKIRKDLSDVWDDSHVTIVSASGPFQKWQPALATTARDISIMLSSALLITNPSPGWLGRYTRTPDSRRVPPVFYLDRARDDRERSPELARLEARPIRQETDLLSLLEIVSDSIASSLQEPDDVPGDHRSAKAGQLAVRLDQIQVTHPADNGVMSDVAAFSPETVAEDEHQAGLILEQVRSQVDATPEQLSFLPDDIAPKSVRRSKKQGTRTSKQKAALQHNS